MTSLCDDVAYMFVYPSMYLPYPQYRDYSPLRLAPKAFRADSISSIALSPMPSSSFRAEAVFFDNPATVLIPASVSALEIRLESVRSSTFVFETSLAGVAVSAPARPSNSDDDTADSSSWKPITDFSW